MASERQIHPGFNMKSFEMALGLREAPDVASITDLIDVETDLIANIKNLQEFSEHKRSTPEGPSRQNLILSSQSAGQAEQQLDEKLREVTIPLLEKERKWTEAAPSPDHNYAASTEQPLEEGNIIVLDTRRKPFRKDFETKTLPQLKKQKEIRNPARQRDRVVNG